MELMQSQQLGQKLILTQEMRQSLAVLQMALPELRSYIQDTALCNPLIELDDHGDVPLTNTHESSATSYADDNQWIQPLIHTRQREDNTYSLCNHSSEHTQSFLDYIHDDSEDNFLDMLREQLPEKNGWTISQFDYVTI